MSLNPSQTTTKTKPRLVADGGNSVARPRKAKTASKTPSPGLSLILPNAQDMATFVPKPMAPSRMKIDVIELAERDPSISFKDAAMRMIGDLSGYIVLGSDLLVATYIKPRKTAGGIYTTDKGAEEDRWQGKVGLVLKLGEQAFRYTYRHDGIYEFQGTAPKVGDYVAFHTSDTREIGIRGVSCRTVDDRLVRMIVPDPDSVY